MLNLSAMELSPPQRNSTPRDSLAVFAPFSVGQVVLQPLQDTVELQKARLVSTPEEETRVTDSRRSQGRTCSVPSRRVGCALDPSVGQGVRKCARLDDAGRGAQRQLGIIHRLENILPK